MSDSAPHFPADLAAVFGCSFMPLLALPFSWLLFRLQNWSFVYLGAVFAVVGVILLVVARLPLYRQRRFFSIGPGPLDLSHRRLYWRGYAFILVGILFLTVVLALPA